MDSIYSNCIGYAYFRLGLCKQEMAMPQPFLEELLKDFDRVPKGKGEALGILDKDSLRVLHMVVIESQESQLVSHRTGTFEGVEENIPLTFALRDYRDWDGYEPIEFSVKREGSL